MTKPTTGEQLLPTNQNGGPTPFDDGGCSQPVFLSLQFLRHSDAIKASDTHDELEQNLKRKSEL